MPKRIPIEAAKADSYPCSRCGAMWGIDANGLPYLSDFKLIAQELETEDATREGILKAIRGQNAVIASWQEARAFDANRVLELEQEIARLREQGKK